MVLILIAALLGIALISLHPDDGPINDAQDLVLQIGHLICLNGFQTDASEPGVERLAISPMRPDAGLCPPMDLKASEIDKDLDGWLDPHQLIFCKGWTRAFCFQSVLLLAYKNEDFFQAR